MLTQRLLIPLPDGREIDVLTTGPEDGFPLVVHGGTPGGLIVDSRIASAAADRGLRFVLTARPGYEGSTPQPGRRVRDVAADVAGVLDALGVGAFVSIGMSGGGPHSLACAALLPGRCLAAASVAGVGPYLADGLDFLAGMGAENVTEFGLAVRGAAALTPYLAFAADWGFSLDTLAERAAIWQGDQDRMVPYAHGQWLAAHTPGARVHLEPGAGHLTMIVTAIDRILDDLLDMAGLPR